MYTYKNIEELDDKQLKTLSEQGYKLCYVDFARGKAYNEDKYEWIPFDDEDETIHYQAYFTPIDLKDQWGDDWDDAPYEYNAGEPYEHYYDNEGQHEINIYVVLFTVQKEVDETLLTPRDFCVGRYGSCVSVSQINSGMVAWMYARESYKTCDGFAIQAGTLIADFVGKIKKFVNKTEQ